MAKDIIYEPGRTFGEFSLLTGYTSKECSPQNINLNTRLYDNQFLKIPLISSPMTSVTGEEMAIALGKIGGMGVLPARFTAEEQAKIVTNIKNQDLSFVDEPKTLYSNHTIEKALSIIQSYGYSTLPIVNKFREFKGMFTQENYWESNVSNADKVINAMIPYKKGDSNIDVSYNPDITEQEAKNILKNSNKKYLVVLDNLERLIKLAFKQDIDTIKVGVATDTYPGWQKRVETVIDTGVDLIVIDSSDAYNENIINAVKEYKSNYKAPLCVGNVITYDGAMALMDAGADLVKEGMSSGSICTTQKVKATGRGPMTSLLETVRARDDYFKKSGRYVSVIADGGITGSADMIIALAGGADLLIMGNYFNKFYEAAGPKLDENKKPTNYESKIRYVETWGEGSDRARNLGRYGHSHRRTFFAEGAEGLVSYAGRLRPNIERDMQIVKAALSNVGAMNLKEFREKAVLELNSIHTSSIVSNIHDISSK